MDAVKASEQLADAGRFKEALAVLAQPHSDRLAGDVLRAELLAHTGDHDQSLKLVERLLSNRRLSAEQRSACEYSLGVIATNEKSFESALTHLQRAVSLAESAGNLSRTCWYQLRLLLIVADGKRSEAASPLLAQIRSNAIKLGEPATSAALHIFLGQLDGKRGLFKSGLQHTRLGQGLLNQTENLWVEGIAHVNLTGFAIMQSDYELAADHARRALGLANECGVAGLRRTALGNLGNVHFQLGHFDESVRYFEESRTIFPRANEAVASAANLALVRLAQGRLPEAAGYFADFAALRTASVPYAVRHSQIVYGLVLANQANYPEALRVVDQAISAAVQCDDHLLRILGTLTKADFFRRMGQHEECLSLLKRVGVDIAAYPPDLFALYERVLGSVLLNEGRPQAAQSHFERSKQICIGIQSTPGLLELAKARNEPPAGVTPDPANAVARSADESARATLLHSVAALMVHVGRPDLIATSTIALLADSGCVMTARAIATREDGSIETLAVYEADARCLNDLDEQTFGLGSARGREIEVRYRPNQDVDSVAAVNAVASILRFVHEVEAGRAEREASLTLWPADEFFPDTDQAVITGGMRDLTMSARRVAQTTVSVLITGESGTGKEILARAIHAHSARADKPFVPFNCTAVPRDLLESQLFGHRRGAFTSADRDHPGLIRAAKDGTLFLDEIGELGLDLQPKLLRFLESGEISPLGEATPFTVDVRIVAATNRDLEQLVREGRFREDLFYRLNVVRLNIPPLRERRDEIPALVNHFLSRAAAEFSKGRLQIAEETMEQLLLYSWPGNIRQLQNELRRLAALADRDSLLTPKALSAEIQRTERSATPPRTNGVEISVPLTDKLIPTLSRVECEMIRVALRAHQGRVEAAAKALGISRKGLYLKRQRLGL